MFADVCNSPADEPIIFLTTSTPFVRQSNVDFAPPAGIVAEEHLPQVSQEEITKPQETQLSIDETGQMTLNLVSTGPTN